MNGVPAGYAIVGTTDVGWIETTPTHCNYQVGDVTQHDCGHPAVALLMDPDRMEQGRCSKHARTCETALEEDRGRYAAYSLRWLS